MPFTHLGDISVDTFLREYWQQKPLLIRQAFANFQSPLSADELAGFALEDWIESRLVWERGSERPWQVEHGPFDKAALTSLPQSGWSLLIQGVETLNDDIARLLQQFHFLPAWRLDDVMASVAPDGASVGPHFDYYDVFLLQGAGERRWLLGEYCDANTALLPDCDMRILQQFDMREEWTLQPGDMLYLPPRLAHWGIAVGQSITYSIGFRSPSMAEVLSEYARDRAERAAPVYYRDPPTLTSDTGTAIPSAAIEQIEALLHQGLADRNAIADWFGRHMTEPRYGDADDEQRDQLHGGNQPDILDIDGIASAQFQHRPANRFAYFSRQSGALLFVNGRSWLTSQAFAKHIARYGIIEGRELAPLLQDATNASNNQQALQELIEAAFLIKTK